MSADDLIERIARALSEHWRDMHTNESLGKQRMLAAAVLPIMEAEVRAAKAAALRDAAENVDVGSLADAWTRGGITRLSVTSAVAEVLMSLRNRATEHETGGRA